MQGEDPTAPLPEYWSKDLECALSLNLSIAYKSIGSMEKAVIHANRYVKLIKHNAGKKVYIILWGALKHIFYHKKTIETFMLHCMNAYSVIALLSLSVIHLVIIYDKITLS